MNVFELIKMANRNLFRNKARSILTILAIFVGSFAIILNSAISTGVNSFIDAQVNSYGGEGAMAIMASTTTSMTSTGLSSGVKEYTENSNKNAAGYISQADMDKIAKIDGVKSVKAMPTLDVEYITSDKTDKKYVLSSIQTRASETIDIATEAGAGLNDSSSEYEVILSPKYVEALGFSSDEEAVGQTVTLAVPNYMKSQIGNNELTKIQAKIVGVQAPGVVSLASAWANQALGNAINDTYMKDVPSEMLDKTVMAEADVETDKIDSVKKALEDMGLTGTSTADMVGAVKAFFNVVIIIFDVFGVIALIAAAIGIINTLLMSVQERTREIGLDKALGMSGGKIFLSFSFEAIMLGFWGSVVGLLVAMLIGNTANGVFHQPGMFLEAFPTLNLTQFTVDGVLPVILLVMVIAFLAGTVPAIQAAKKDPIDALRYE